MPGNIVNLTPADIAKWPKPNYIDPDRRTWMPEYASILYAGATIMVGTRLCLRLRRQAGGLGLDDISLILSWMCLSWFTAVAIVSSEVYMINRHVWDVPITKFVTMAKFTWMGEIAFLMTSCFVKLAVLLFYRRLVEPICSKGWIAAVLVAIAVTILYTLALVLALVFNCTPTEAYWKSFDLTYSVKYHCVNTTKLNILAGTTAAVSDLYAVVLPCIMMRKLSLPRPQKIALNAVFCLGLVVVAASGVRTYYLYKTGHTSDVTSAIFNVYVWSQLELSLGIMCASAPACRVLFREYLNGPISRLKRSVTSGNKSSSGRTESEIEHVIIRRIASPGFEVERHDFSAKHTPTTSTINSLSPVLARNDSKDPVRVEEVERVMTPADYESYNLRSMERYRQYSRSQSVMESVRTEDMNMQGRSWLNI